MNINRERDQGGIDTAIERLCFCLDKLEQAESFNNKIDWGTEIVPMLTLEEIIGALVSAEQELRLEQDLHDPHELSDMDINDYDEK